MALIFITHDISIVGNLCDNLAVFYGGLIVEYGPKNQVLSHPTHPYTEALLEALPVLGEKRERLRTIQGGSAQRREPAQRLPVPPALRQGDGPVQRRRTAAHLQRGKYAKDAVLVGGMIDISARQVGEVIIEARNGVKHYVIKTGLMNSRTAGIVRAVDDVSFAIHENETFALVGESGCGKSTMAILILKLVDPTSGDILFRGASLSGMSTQDTRGYRRNVQAVLQDPYGALNPRMRVGHIIGEPLEVHGVGTGDREEPVAEALRSVGLPEWVQTQFPHEFSGGQ